MKNIRAAYSPKHSTQSNAVTCVKKAANGTRCIARNGRFRVQLMRSSSVRANAWLIDRPPVSVRAGQHQRAPGPQEPDDLVRPTHNGRTAIHGQGWPQRKRRAARENANRSEAPHPGLSVSSAIELV